MIAPTLYCEEYVMKLVILVHIPRQSSINELHSLEIIKCCNTSYSPKKNLLNQQNRTIVDQFESHLTHLQHAFSLRKIKGDVDEL